MCLGVKIRRPNNNMWHYYFITYHACLIILRGVCKSLKKRSHLFPLSFYARPVDTTLYYCIFNHCSFFKYRALSNCCCSITYYNITMAITRCCSSVFHLSVWNRIEIFQTTGIYLLYWQSFEVDALVIFEPPPFQFICTNIYNSKWLRPRSMWCYSFRSVGYFFIFIHM